MADPVLVVAEVEFTDAVNSKRVWGLVAVMAALFFLVVFSVRFAGPQQQPVDPLSSVLAGLRGSVGFAAPLLGLALGYAAVSGDRERGFLYLVLARPVSRGQVIDGKVLGAAAVLVLVLGLSAMVLLGSSSILLGVALDAGSLTRVAAYALLTALLALAYFSVALLFSVISKKSSQSLVLSIVVWLLFVFVIPLLGFFYATSVVGPPPPTSDAKALEEWSRRAEATVSRLLAVTPNYYFDRLSGALMSTRAAPLEHWWADLAVLALYAAVPYLLSRAAFTASEEK